MVNKSLKNMQKIKILYIHHGTGIGGAGISLLNTIIALDKNRFNVKVLFVKDSPLLELFKQNNIAFQVLNDSNIYYQPSATIQPSIIHYIKFFMGVYHWIRVAFYTGQRVLAKQDVDIVHLNSSSLSHWALAAKRMRFKVVMHIREPIAFGLFGAKRQIIKRLLEKSCDHIICISRDNQERLGIYSKSSVIYNFTRIPEIIEMPQRVSSIIVLYLGGTATIKGFKTVVRTVEFLDKNVVLLFGGSIVNTVKDSRIKGFIKHLIKFTIYRGTYEPMRRLGAYSNVKIIGLVKNPEEYLENCSMLITPFSKSHFSRPAIEAFAYGKPVVGTNVAGMDEIIDDKVNGLLVPPNDPKALAEAINFLARNPELACKMGEHGRAKAKEYYSPEVSIPKIEKVYVSLCHKKQLNVRMDI